MFTRSLVVILGKGSRTTGSIAAQLSIMRHMSYGRYSSGDIFRSSTLISPRNSTSCNLSSVRAPLLFNSARCLSDSNVVATGTVLEKTIEPMTNSVVDISNVSQESIQSVMDKLVPNMADIPLTELGIGSNYTPIGWCVHYLDFLHSAFPWWASIAIGTVCLRLALFPFVVKGQRSSAKMTEVLPEQAKLKEAMNQARLTGDNIEFARLAQESHSLFKRRNINPFTSMLAPLAQAPVFITFFLTLRRMANYPVESMKTGGLAWFADLSVPDPYYVMPVFCALTLWTTLEISFRTGMNPNQNVAIKYGMRVVPLVALGFTFNFPAAIMMYWCTNNLLSVGQVLLLKQPAVRSFLDIPQIKIKPMQLDVNQKSFTTHFKETLENAKINRIMEERKTVDEVSFRRAGIGPIKKTYKYNPTTTPAATPVKMEANARKSSWKE